MNIKNNITTINQQIAQACETAHRPVNSVDLLAVSKTKPAELIEQAYQAGQRHFGESYVQEAIDKISQLQHLPDITWHFIGPIQSNKTRLIAENFAWVHSVDRIKIATRLNEQRCTQDTPLNICLQVNISGESSKAGITIEELPELVNFIKQCEHLQLRGLMAIPEKNANASTFKQMFSLFNDLKSQDSAIDTLSMGMSNDMTIAIAQGSTMVRVGTAIFGQRQ